MFNFFNDYSWLMLRIIPFLILLIINRTSILRSLTYSYYIIMNRLLSIDWIFFAQVLCIIIIVFTYIYCTSDYIYCADFVPGDNIINELNRLKSELDFWQADTQELITRYEEKGYKSIHPSNLSEIQLKDKEELASFIKDGRDNVRTSIRDLAEFKSKYNLEQDTSVLGKRNNTQPESSNKR